MVMRRLASVGTAAALLLLAGAAWGQMTPRSLTGTVVDGANEPLRGAVVQVENVKTESVVTLLTDRTGHFSFKRLESGTDYKYFATYRGHRSRTRRLGMFDSKADETVSLMIRLE
jgi:hypothetical protein